MTWKNIPKKTIFILIVVFAVSFALQQMSTHKWTMETFHFGCPTLRTNPAPGLKPKHTNIVFLKTHKTASSTMQNLLFRFAERNNLTVALPVQSCGHQFCYPSIFKSHFVHPHTLPANIITNHMHFSKTALQDLMPNNTIYVTIIREPTSMFESLFTYYRNRCQSFKRVLNGSLEAFLNNPFNYYRPEEGDSMYAHNSLTFDLGGDKDRPPTDVAYAQAFVAEVERAFSLVMISDYFDESLVLLRHLLSWDLDDILYLKLNMRAVTSKKSLTPGLSAKIRAWNSIDAYLYDHFNASLWRKLSALGLACVSREVQLLQQHQERVMRDCFGGNRPLIRIGGNIKNAALRPWKPDKDVDIVGYDLPANISHEMREICLKYIMPELSYTQMLLRSQSQRYLENHRIQSPPKSQNLQQPKQPILPRDSQVRPNQPPAPGAYDPVSVVVKSTLNPVAEIKKVEDKP
ncbi:galactose-3-O-sulfotransferase 3-like [Cololabis saira]|uniref:galactose-3-O-sulfotransferase 3-like n=1 Tax=Cololabis saira TaxID=129043 RepID=UPI002AD1DE41|nr:galactose-3-O-sulfotransferase 3-like [Cololabis saira]